MTDHRHDINTPRLIREHVTLHVRIRWMTVARVRLWLLARLLRFAAKVGGVGMIIEHEEVPQINKSMFDVDDPS